MAQFRKGKNESSESESDFSLDDDFDMDAKDNLDAEYTYVLQFFIF